MVIPAIYSIHEFTGCHVFKRIKCNSKPADFTQSHPVLGFRWVNENLKSSKLTLNDIEKDLSDGLKLIALIECLSGKKFPKYNKKPTFRTQKFENVTVSLKFLEQDEGIKIVNIGKKICLEYE